MNHDASIATFLKFVLCSYEGQPIKMAWHALDHKPNKTLADPEMSSIFERVIGPAALAEWKKDYAKKTKEMKLICDACSKPEEKAKNGKMQACSRCNAIGREVRYCDK